MSNLFSNYKSKSNSDVRLRVNNSLNHKRLYVSKRLAGQKLIVNEKGIVSISDSGLKVNNQYFISLNRMSNSEYKHLLSLNLKYSKAVSDLIAKA